MGFETGAEIRLEVGKFAVEMEEKLKARDKYHPNGWSEDTNWDLLEAILDKTDRLEDLLGEEILSHDDVHKLAVDIGNFAMMIADKSREGRVEDMKSNLTLSKLEGIFDNAVYVDANYIAVAIEFDEADDVEIIINPIENVEYKLKYCKESYNEDLTHKYAKGVRILAVAFGDTFEEIEQDLLDK